MFKRLWKAVDGLWAAFDADMAEMDAKITDLSSKDVRGDTETLREEEIKPDGTRITRVFTRTVSTAPAKDPQEPAT